MIKICIFYNKDLHNTPSFTVVAATVRPLLGGAAPFSSRHRRATFPAIGKVYPTKLGRAERAKVDFTFQLSIFNLLAPLCTLKNSPRGEMKQKTREEKLK